MKIAVNSVAVVTMKNTSSSDLNPYLKFLIHFGVIIMVTTNCI
jgi:hypothetical protein